MKKTGGGWPESVAHRGSQDLSVGLLTEFPKTGNAVVVVVIVVVVDIEARSSEPPNNGRTIVYPSPSGSPASGTTSSYWPPKLVFYARILAPCCQGDFPTRLGHEVLLVVHATQVRKRWLLWHGLSTRETLQRTAPGSLAVLSLHDQDKTMYYFSDGQASKSKQL
jgi:hypothetical protein